MTAAPEFGCGEADVSAGAVFSLDGNRFAAGAGMIIFLKVGEIGKSGKVGLVGGFDFEAMRKAEVVEAVFASAEDFNAVDERGFSEIELNPLDRVLFVGDLAVIAELILTRRLAEFGNFSVEFFDFGRLGFFEGLFGIRETVLPGALFLFESWPVFRRRLDRDRIHG